MGPLQKKISIGAAGLLCVFSIVSISGADPAPEASKGDASWCPVSAGPVTTWTAPLCEKGKIAVQSFFFTNKTRGTFDAEGRENDLPAGDDKVQYQQQIFIQYGLAEHLELAAQTVYQENYVKQGGRKAHDAGLGDSVLFLRACLLEETQGRPHVTALFQAKFPTGKYQKVDSDKLGADLMGAASGGGSYDQGFGVILTKTSKPFVFHADAIVSFPQEVRVDGVKTRYGNYANYDFGAEWMLPKGFNLLLEFNGFLQGDKKQAGDRVPASDISFFAMAPGIGWSNDTVQTIIAYQRTLLGTNTDANDSVVATCVLTF